MDPAVNEIVGAIGTTGAAIGAYLLGRYDGQNKDPKPANNSDEKKS